MTVYSINEPWSPGIEPDADEAAAVLIGRENVQKLRLAGIQLSSHFWEETRNAVIAAGGKVVAQEYEALHDQVIAALASQPLEPEKK